MKKKYVVISFIPVLLFIQVSAQNQFNGRVDSLLGALRNYQSLCKIPCLQDSNKIKILIALESEISGVNSDSSVLIGKEALSLARMAGWQAGIAFSLGKLAATYQFMGKYQDAIEYFKMEILKWDEIEKDSKIFREMAFFSKAKALNNIGTSLDFLGQYDEALNYFKETLILFNKMGNKDNIAQTLSNIAVVLSEQGKYPESVEHYFEALKIFEGLDNKLGVSKILGNIGIIYEAQSDYIKALDYFLRALKIAEELGVKKSIASDQANIAMVYSSLNDFENSLTYYTKALPVAEEERDKYLVALILNNTGEVYDKKRDFVIAKEYYLKALPIFRDLQIQNGVAGVLGNLGSLYLQINNYRDAEIYMLKSLSLYDSLGALNEIMKMNGHLSDFFSKTGDYKKALQYYQFYIRAKDSLFDQNKTKEIAKKEFAYEQEKKDVVSKLELEKQKLIRNVIAWGAGIIILSSLFSFMFYKHKRDAVQRQKETALNLQVSETEMKALRSQMNPHFIFNALQSIQNFLVNHKSEEANIYLLKFSKLMRLVLENSQHSEVPLKQDIKALELYMQLESIRLQYPFTYRFHIGESIDEENDSLPPLILQPFVENAIWHGLQYKHEPGHIKISIFKRDHTLFATVEDNGVGRSITKQGIHPILQRKESLGIKLTEERLKILNEQKAINAQFEIIDLFTSENQPSGTKVELSLPLP